LGDRNRQPAVRTFLKYLTALAAFAGLELAELIASVLGVLAALVFITAAYLSFNALHDRLPTGLNLVTSCVLALLRLDPRLRRGRARAT
jgi:hypothetical protein